MRPQHKATWGMFFTLLVFLACTVAFAATTTLTTALTREGLTLNGDHTVRFQVDYPNTTLVIFDARLASTDEPLPAGVTATTAGADLKLRFPQAFGVSLAPNGLSLTVRQSEAPLANTPNTGGPSSANPTTATNNSSTSPAANPSPNPTASPSGGDARLPLFIPLNNANPQYVAGLLTRTYGVRVEVDERQRSIIVFVKSEDQDLIRQFVAELDKPRPQVMFEAEILEINQYMTQSLGIDYRELFSFNLTEGIPPGFFELGDLKRSSLSIKIGFDLLKTTGAARTLAQPRVTAMDGVEARLNATQTTPIVTAGTNNTVIVNNVTTGITLRLLPKVGADGGIESSLSIAVSTPTGLVNNVPKYSTREASTTVRVRNGEPIVIGGLLESRNTSDSRGIPGLMDLPVLGELFKTTTTDTRFTDLVIMVTPYLVGAGQAYGPQPAPTPAPSAPVRDGT